MSNPLPTKGILMSSTLGSFLPASIPNKKYPLEALQIKPSHLPSLVPLTIEEGNPLQWFHTEIINLEDLLFLPSHVVYSILVKDQVAGFFYFKEWEGLQPDELEMAYCLLSSFRGKRILELTLLTILGSLFEKPIPKGKLEKVCAFVDGENDASKIAHARLGLVKTDDTVDTENPKIIYHRYEISRECWKQVASRLETNIKQKW
jgi:hypothetical protein